MDPRPNPAPLPPDALVSHASFVRRVAFAILRDDADADDATQETLATGLASGPRDAGATRGWLAAVVRNAALRLRRREARIGAREQRASRPETTAATVDVVTQQETLRAVVDAVGALDAASREVVILRHYEGVPPREIAARLGVPVETVKKRLTRAHARLRTHLDVGEGRARRRRALAAFAGLSLPSREGTVAVATGEGAVMASSGKLALIAGAAVLAVGAGVWVVASRDGGSESGPATPSAVADATTTADGRPPAAVDVPLAAAGREALPTLVMAAGPKVRALPSGWSRHTWGTLSLALPDAWNTDDARDLEVQTWIASGPDGRPAGVFGVASRTAAEALRAKLPEERITRSLVVLGEASTWTEVTKDGKVAAIVSFDAPTATTPDIQFVAMAPAALWPGHAKAFEEVLSWVERAAAPPSGAPTVVGKSDDMSIAAWGGTVPGDRVEGRVVRGPRGFPGATVRLVRASLVASIDGRDTEDVIRETTTAGDGVFSWSGIEPGRWAVVVRAPDMIERRAWVETRVPPALVARVVVVLGTATIEGRGFARDGTSAHGRTVRLVEQRPRGSATQARVTLDGQGRFRAAGLTAGLWALRLDLEDDPNGDHRDLAVETEACTTTTVTLGTDEPEPMWRGTARLASGTPLHDPIARLHVASAAPTTAPTSVDLRPDPRGAFAQRLPAGGYRVMLAGVPAVAMHTFVLEVGAGGLTRDVTVPGVLVTGTLVDGDTRRPFPPAPPGRGPSVGVRRVDEAVSPAALGFAADASGTFRLFGVPPGRYVVYARPGPGDDREGSSVEIAVPADRDVTGLALDVRVR